MSVHVDPIALATHAHTMTQLVDYPMFERMLHLAMWMFGGMGAIILLLGAAAWNDLRRRIGSQRREDIQNCADHRLSCNKHHIREFDALWANVNKHGDKIGIETIRPTGE